eukprot:gb/GFBE01000570.1/.p1 GENE.gb/GFBE01000570.1/~~gb/GFBE01000570.1/.p1  ORF type:complete len:301 (+),score=91.55 gb/GFBE01000570.1/:1-903(+)
MFGSSQSFAGGLSMGASQANSPERPKARQEEKSSCLPVTVRLLELTHEAAKTSGGDLRFHGVETEPNMLTLVAAVEAVHSKQATCMEFTINDSTGRIRARHFPQDPEQEKSLEGLVEGAYVSVFGSFRTSPMPHFSVQGMRPVTSADEISYHMIEVAHAAMKCQVQSGGLAMRDPATPASKQVRPAPEAAAHDPITPPKSQSEPQQDVVMQATQELAAKLPTPQEQPPLEGAVLREALLKFLQDGSGNEQGFTTGEALIALQKTGAKVAGGEATLRTLMVSLVEEGEVFNAADDDHFSAL